MRGADGADITAVLTTVQAFAAVFEAHSGDICELEINPLRVFPASTERKPTALDVVVLGRPV